MKLLMQKSKKVFSSFCKTASGKPWHGSYLGLMDRGTTDIFFVRPLSHSPIRSRSIAPLTC